MGHHQLDTLDEQILQLIADNARIPFLEVARACNVSGARPIDGRVEMMAGVCFRLYPGRGSSESSTGTGNEIRRKTKDLWLKITEKTFTATRAMRVRSAGPNAAMVRSC